MRDYRNIVLEAERVALTVNARARVRRYDHERKLLFAFVDENDRPINFPAGFRYDVMENDVQLDLVLTELAAQCEYARLSSRRSAT